MNKQLHTNLLSKVELLVFEVERLQDEVDELLESRDALEYGLLELE